MWADQLFDDKEEYFSSMSNYIAGQFDPDYQLKGGWMNPTSGTSSIGSFSRWQVMPADGSKKLHSFTGDYNDNALEDCQHQDAFLQYVCEVFRDDTESLVEFEQPIAGMSVPWAAFHASYNGKFLWEEALAKQ